ncbi:inactive lipase [Mycobacteroides abscessus subsp. massiliense]|nr:inactive lipase [Mycobacteroides abscessus subsp. massiliense]
MVVRNQAINSLGLKFTPSYRLTHLWYRDNPPMFPFLSAQNYAVLFPDHEGPRMSYAAGKMAGHALLAAIAKPLACQRGRCRLLGAARRARHRGYVRDPVGRQLDPEKATGMSVGAKTVERG